MNISAKVLSLGWNNDGLFKSNLAKIIYQGKSIPREDDNIMHVRLKQEIEKIGHKIHTFDLWGNEKISLEMHFDYNLNPSKNIKSYLILPEVHELYIDNHYDNIIKKFDKIFTFNDSHVDGKKFIKLVHPIVFNDLDPVPFFEKTEFSCLIGSNKSLQKIYNNCGYTERYNLARWFELNHYDKFNLYGSGWSNIKASNSFLNKVFFNIFEKIKFDPSFLKKVNKGPIKNKTEILLKHKYTFCYENALNIPGYFCELIFDAFNGMCVPVYWGCSNVSQYIPEDCFIDRRNFSNNNDLLKFLISLGENEYMDYQENIKNFKKSNLAEFFNVDNFVNTIIKHIKLDFE